MFGLLGGVRGDWPGSSRSPPVTPEEDEATGAPAPWPGTWTGFFVRGAEPLGELERFMNAI